MSANYITLLASWTWTLLVFVDDVKEELRSFDEKTKTENNPVELKKIFNKFIAFHAEVKG